MLANWCAQLWLLIRWFGGDRADGHAHRICANEGQDKHAGTPT